MRVFVFGAAILLSGCAGVFASSGTIVSDVEKNAIVYFGWDDGEHFFFNGTAFFVSANGCVLTTDHEARSVAVIGKRPIVRMGASILELEKITSFQDRDLALFKGSRPVIVPFLKITERDEFPIGGIFVINRKSRIRKTAVTMYPPEKIRVRQPDGSFKSVFGYTVLDTFRPGESGSPVLTPAAGEVVGIIVGGSSSSSSLSGGLVAPISLAFLEKSVPNYRSLCKSAQ